MLLHGKRLKSTRLRQCATNSMKALEYEKLAIRNLYRKRGRSSLTMLGMVIGVASVIMMLAVGQATERFILAQITTFGSDLIIVGNGKGDGSAGGGPDPTVKKTLTKDDYDALKQRSWTRLVDANFFTRDVVTYGGRSSFVEISGVTEDNIDIYSAEMSEGRFLSSDDVALNSRVAVLGENVRNDFFGLEDPIGKRMKLGKFNYRVIGILAPGGTRFFSNVDDQIYVPFTTLMRNEGQDRLTVMLVKTNIENVSDAKNEIRLVLRDQHNINNPLGLLAKDDFIVRSQEDVEERAGSIGTILQILLGSIAAISLVVGGIGIMNIMYVTVKERTREIGLRKAIGARRANIRNQFLLEAATLTIVGGVLGIVTGVLLSWSGLTLLGYYQEGWAFAMPWDAVALGFGVSCLIGITFGYLPANRAAKLQAIDALRYE
ncbi:FtsX-like permease family protein [Candidatus Uhrbacteria bacterium]|nr:FtsX-like permease family protein [Candidatus Uhrbacteria bacterium]MBD3283982.1 FtsX-like permease family protein [Candidatus Uhrbacteria bacterium]